MNHDTATAPTAGTARTTGDRDTADARVAQVCRQIETRRCSEE